MFNGLPSSQLTIALEGNIGCGKSIMLNQFSKNEIFQVVEEPINKWTTISEESLYGLYLKDAPRWAFSFQNYIQLTMLQCHLTKQESHKRIRIMERSIHGSFHIFVKNIFRRNLMNQMEYNMLKEWYDWIVKHHNTKIDILIYLRTSPNVSLDRLRIRNRSEEASLNIDYPKYIHEAHEKWFATGNWRSPDVKRVMVIDANQDLSTMSKNYEIMMCHLSKINSFDENNLNNICENICREIGPDCYMLDD